MSSINYEELRKSTRIFITKPPTESTVCMEVIIDGFRYIIGTLGGISMIQGAKKARKTYLGSAYTASLLSGEKIINLQGYLPQDKKKVLFFDTEQGSRSVRKVQNRIHQMAGLPINEESENFHYYSLRGISMELRSNLIHFCLENTPDVGAIIIDGGRDLIKSFNDDGESFTIVDKLLNWSDKYQIHIAVVLHENPGSDKARGHLGTELGNKAECILKIKKVDSTYSSVESENREKDFPKFYFTIDENDYPIVGEIEETKGRQDPKDLSRDTHINIIDEIFKGKDDGYSFSKTSLCPVLKSKFAQYTYKYGDQAIKDLIDFYLVQNILENVSLGKGWKLVQHSDINRSNQTKL